MFREALNDLFNRHRERLLIFSDVVKVDAAFELLEENELSVEYIDMAVCSELKTVLNKKNDFQTDCSMRLDKFGWSAKRIEDHMYRFFEAKMKSAGKILSTVEATGPKETKQPEKSKVYDDELNELDDDGYGLIYDQNRKLSRIEE